MVTTSDPADLLLAYNSDFVQFTPENYGVDTGDTILGGSRHTADPDGYFDDFAAGLEAAYGGGIYGGGGDSRRHYGVGAISGVGAVVAVFDPPTSDDDVYDYDSDEMQETHVQEAHGGSTTEEVSKAAQYAAPQGLVSVFGGEFIVSNDDETPLGAGEGSMDETGAEGLTFEAVPV